MDLGQVWYEGGVWFHAGLDYVLEYHAFVHLCVLEKARNFFTS
jgi:hypothetical protein